jgi:hypothetical protein
MTRETWPAKLMITSSPGTGFGELRYQRVAVVVPPALNAGSFRNLGARLASGNTRGVPAAILVAVGATGATWANVGATGGGFWARAGKRDDGGRR